MCKIYPLGHKSSIKLLSSKGKTTSSKEAKIIVFANNKIDTPLKQGIHLAFAASKKVFQKAVDRNRVKRRLRGALHESIKNLEYKETIVSMLIIPRRSASKANFETLKNLISQSLQKLNA